MAQNYTWPSVSVTATNPSVALNGQSPSATSSTLVAGQNPSGAQEPLQTTTDGSLLVASDPASTGNVNLTEVSGSSITLGQKLSAASLPVVLASDETVPISAVSLPLPTGASTSALQTTGNTTLSGIEANQTNGTQVTSVSNFPATQPVSGTVTVVQPTASNLLAQVSQPTASSLNATVVQSTASNLLTQVSQPTASSLNATVVQTTGSNLHVVVDSGSVSSTQGTSPWVDNISQFGGSPVSLGQAVSASSIPVVIASDQSAVPISASSLPLPTGAATSANQVIELSRLSGSLVPTAYDEIDLTYITSGNGTGQIGTALYKLATVLQKTLTLTYDSSNRLSSVVAS